MLCNFIVESGTLQSIKLTESSVLSPADVIALTFLFFADFLSVASRVDRAGAFDSIELAPRVGGLAPRRPITLLVCDVTAYVLRD